MCESREIIFTIIKLAKKDIHHTQKSCMLYVRLLGCRQTCYLLQTPAKQKKNEVGITKEQNKKTNGKGSVFGRCDQILTQIRKIKSSSNNGMTF